MKNILSLVIPCKNEGNTIMKTLDLLNYQSKISGVKVIVCDSSDDGITKTLLLERSKKKYDSFNLILVPGGFPSIARNNGFKSVITPYVLFLDSDVFLLDENCILNSLKKAQKDSLDLVTLKFRTHNGKFNYVYWIFDAIQKISRYISPFCLGGFMLVRSQKFLEIGGFNEEIKISEDYMFSRKIKRRKFKVEPMKCFTLPRRFENKGLLYMIKIMISSYVNRNNISYFKKDGNYWK